MKSQLSAYLVFALLLLLTHKGFSQCSYQLVNNSANGIYAYTTNPPVSGNTSITWYLGSNVVGTSPVYTTPSSSVTLMTTICAEITDSLCPQPIVICDTVVRCDYQFTHHVSGNNIYLNNTPFVFSPAFISWTVNGNALQGTNDPTYVAPGPGTYIICMAVVDPTCSPNNTFYHCDTIVIPVSGCNYNFTHTVSGDTIRLDNSPQVQAPATINWTVNGNPITGTNDPMYVAPGPGTYIVCMIVVNMSCQPNPTTYVCDTIVIPVSGCNYNFTHTVSGDTIRLDNSPQVQAPATINWTVNGNPITGTNDPMYVAPGPGIYIVCMIVVDMSCLPNPTTYVCDTISIPPTGCNYNFTHTLSGDTLTLFNNPQVSAPATIQWRVNGVVVSNGNNPVHVLGGPGVYEVCLLIVNPACTLNNTYYHCDTLYLYGVGSEALLSNNTLQIYPNPATDEIHISVSGYETSENVLLEVFDMYGRSVQAIRIPGSELGGNLSISSKGLDTGIYILSITGNTFRATGRIRVMR